MQRPFQLVIFGASGFTGQRIVEDLVRFLDRSKYPLKWAIAGRNVDKLRKTLDIVSSKTNHNLSKIQVIKASLEDSNSLSKMGEATSLVMNCTGPFRSTGPPVADACIKTNTDYLDIAGEPQFMEETQLKYHKIAQDKGIYLIPGSGFDCIPSDCGVNYLKSNFNGKVDDIEIFLSVERGSFMKGNITTWYSAVDGFADIKTLTAIRKKLLKEVFGDVKTHKVRENDTLRPRHRKPFSRFQDSQISGYILPFKGADPSVIRRTQMHCELLYNDPPCSVQMYSVYDLEATLRWSILGISLLAFSGSEGGRRLLKTFPRFFSGGVLATGGPSEEEMQRMGFCMTIKATGKRDSSDGSKVGHQQILRIRGPHPGYPACAVCINQAAVTLIEERSLLPLRGGVFTPGAAFRKTSIMKRLAANGCRIDLEEGRDVIVQEQ